MAHTVNLSVHSKPVRLAAHCIGLNNKDPYKRHGKLFYRPYRNYFATHDKSSDYDKWKELCTYGYAKFEIGKSVGNHNHITFYLTRHGLDWLGETLGITIYDEED